MPRFAKRGIWCGSSEAGKTQESVAEYVDRMHRAGFNLLLVHLKGGNGRIWWPSERFKDLVQPGYEEFDLPAALLAECRKRGMELHAWFIDYMDGQRTYEEHPEWAVRNAAGLPTSSEVLRGKPFDAVWMCPAQRPGYTDQRLVPIYEEFAEKYDFDAIHHDYIRYPGDLAPDQYCFCDYCLENIPKWAGYLTEAFPDEPFYHELYDREYLEAHWEQSPRVLPANWDRLPRATKSRFLLEGSFFQGGRYDLDYFFYAYRVHWVREFARLCREAVNRARPGMKISAAVFKNPIHSGRFIGQDWRTFAGYVDHMLPMDYRDHYPGSFETYLALLAESIHQQKEWARDFEALWPGIAINFLYKEEEKAGAKTFSPEKFERVVETIHSTGVEGMIVFCEGHLHQFGLWDAARSLFRD
ncbi:MAG TPA: putative glycoside hydrolase [Fimbriimonadaceae bacterium]|nr:putative glycoside hydrolase [Fimbriimonadaceae bacterium]